MADELIRTTRTNQGNRRRPAWFRSDMYRTADGRYYVVIYPPTESKYGKSTEDAQDAGRQG